MNLAYLPQGKVALQNWKQLKQLSPSTQISEAAFDQLREWTASIVEDAGNYKVVGLVACSISASTGH